MSDIAELLARGMSNSKAWPVVFEAGSATTLARAAMAALDTAGYVIVPKIETDDMCEAGLEALRDNLGHSEVIMRDAAACYRAMVLSAKIAQVTK